MSSAITLLAWTEEERLAVLDRMWRGSDELLGILDHRNIWVSLNPAWTRALGWSVGDILAKDVAWLEPPSEDGRLQAEIVRLYAGLTSTAFRASLRCHDGNIKVFSWRAMRSGDQVLLVGRDITNEQERETLLRDSEDFARLALEAVEGVGVWTYDVATDCFTCDAAVAELYGVEVGAGAAGVKREAFLANVLAEDREKLRATMAGGLVQSGDLELEYRIRHSGGPVRWVLSRGHTYFDADDRPMRRTGVAVETTQRRVLEEQLRQSQKMEAVGQLTGGLAHDFNNLLAGIAGNLELLQTRLAQGRLEDLNRYAESAQGAVKRAVALTHRLLAFSRRQTLDSKPTKVNLLVSGMEDLIRRTVGPEILVESILSETLWTTFCDSNQLENAILNLAINARDAMPEGGRLTIETANVVLDQRAAHERDMGPGYYVELCVTDTGTGMPPDVIAHAFDPFYTTKPTGQGTGLGLSMIYGFAKQSGGQVRIYSEVNAGTTMRIYLPRYIGDAEVADAPSSLPDLPLTGQGETVLVVDDEPTVRMLITEVLEELGYKAIEAADGPAGLRAVRSETRIDLMITDVGLPGGLNGRQLADAARQIRPKLKILFITGFAENAAVKNGQLDAGMEVMTKPFALEALAVRIRKIITSDS